MSGGIYIGMDVCKPGYKEYSIISVFKRHEDGTIEVIKTEEHRLTDKQIRQDYIETLVKKLAEFYTVDPQNIFRDK